MSNYHIGVILGLSTALTFTFLSMWARGMQRQEGPIRYVCYMSIIPGVVALLSWIAFPPQMHWTLVKAALLLTPVQFLGSLTMGLALSKGDVSHVTPIFGSKPLIVTLIASSLALEPATPNLWLASIVVFVALFLLNGKREVILKPWLVLQPVVLLVIVSCACYGINDLVTKYYVNSAKIPVWDFLSINWVVRGLVMAGFLMVYTRKRRESMLPRRWPLAIIAAPVLVVHAVAFVMAMKLTESAIVVNILSSMRGLVSVLLIFGLGIFSMGNYERMTRPMIFSRLAGSLLVCLAIYLALGLNQPASSPETPPADSARPIIIETQPAAPATNGPAKAPLAPQ